MVTPLEPRTGSSEQAKPPFWRNITVVKWIAQIAFLAFFVWFFWILITQAASNLADTGIPFSWDFLAEPLGVLLGEGFTTQPASGIEALAVGMVNMLRITLSGVVAATLLGTLIGIARLSKNWIVSQVANAYIEFFRNIPLLVQIFFWSALITTIFGELTADQEGKGWFFSSSKGVAIPWLIPEAGRWQYIALILLGAVVARLVYKWRVRILEQQGVETHAMRWALSVFAGFIVLGWFIHPVMGVFGWLWSALAWVFGNLPVWVFQLALAALAIWLAYRFIKKFLDDRRTPAGLAKLTEDDYFRLVVAGFLGLATATFFLLGPGSATVSRILGRDLTFTMNWGLEPLFEFLATKFDFSAGAPLNFSQPEVVVTGVFPQYSLEAGRAFTPAYLAVWIGVTLYTAAFIGEIVRAGIMAVHRGQNEAASSMGLKRGQVLRLVVLPQAFRIILPPLGSQYLNLAKNTSLGIAVAYADIVQVGQTIYNQEGQTLAVFIIWMAFYSAVSLILSGIVNYYNRKMQLVER